MDEKQQKIAARAYQKFIMRGGDHGHDFADWLEAEKEIEAEAKAGQKTKTVKPKVTKAPSSSTRKKSARK
jgi:hypothetical protein